MAPTVRSCVVFLVSSFQPSSVLALRDLGTEFTEHLAETQRHEASDAHSVGLELEHDMKAKWAVTKEESKVIKAMVKENLQGKGFDAPWDWSDEGSSWTWGFVKLTSGSPQHGLAYHMLHSHGLAAFIAANTNKGNFAKFLAERQGKAEKAEGREKAEFLTESLKSYDKVVELYEFFTSKISLSALRNIHAYDHQWAVDQGFGDQCKEAPGTCILQAGFSKQAYTLMSGGGYTEEVCKEMDERQNILYAGFQKTMSPHFQQHFTSAHTTGKIENHVLKIVGKSIVGAIQWEDGGVSDVLVPLSESMKAAVGNDQAKMLHMVELWIERQTEKFRNWFAPNRIILWAGEDAEFTQMYPQIA